MIRVIRGLDLHANIVLIYAVDLTSVVSPQLTQNWT